MGNAFIHKNKIVIAPESKDRKGIIYAKSPNPYENAWVADIEVKIGNKDNSFKPAGMFAIYYLRSMEKVSHEDSP